MQQVPPTVALLKLIKVTEILIELAESLEPQLKELNAEAAKEITKDGDSRLVVGNNLGVKYMTALADINARFACDQLKIATAEVRAAIDEVLGRSTE